MDSDWRLQGQDEYLLGLAFKVEEFKSSPAIKLKNEKLSTAIWEHEHCEFCGKKFSLLPEHLSSGHVTMDGTYWVCEECFCDFKALLHFREFSESIFQDKSFIQILRQEVYRGDMNLELYGIGRIAALSSALKDAKFIQSNFIATPYIADIRSTRNTAQPIPYMRQIIKAGTSTNADYCAKVNKILAEISSGVMIQDCLRHIKQEYSTAMPGLYIRVDE